MASLRFGYAEDEQTARKQHANKHQTTEDRAVKDLERMHQRGRNQARWRLVKDCAIAAGMFAVIAAVAAYVACVLMP